MHAGRVFGWLLNQWLLLRVIFVFFFPVLFSRSQQLLFFGLKACLFFPPFLDSVVVQVSNLTLSFFFLYSQTCPVRL